MTQTDTWPLPSLPAVSSLTRADHRYGRPLVPAGGPTIARKRSMPARSPLRVSVPVVLCALLLAAGSGACSFMFVDGPPEKHRQLPYFVCTTSRAWPVVDTVLGAAYGIEAIAAASLSSANSNSTAGGTPAAVAVGAVAALFVASAVSGYGKASACREATDELQVRLTRMQPTPGFGFGQPGVPPYQPPTPYDPWVTPPAGNLGASPPAPPPPPPPPAAGAPAPAPKSNPPRAP